MMISTSFRLPTALLLVACLTGCVTKEGVGFQRITLHDPDYHTASARWTKEHPGTPLAVIAIGYTSAYRAIDDTTAGALFEEYANAVRLLDPDAARSLSIADFRAAYAGWSLLKVDGIPGISGSYLPVLVPHDMASKVRFASTMSTVLVQNAEDLVAAPVDRRGFFVLDRLLCAEGDAFDACDARYSRGVFDAASGAQLDGKYAPMDDGTRIDVHSLHRQ